MNCPNCGAPMTLYRSRDYYHCEHCGGYHFPDQDQDGLRVLGENPEGIDCPRCRVVLRLVNYADFFQGYQCPKCQGLLFNRTTFREAIDFQRSRIKTPPDPYSTFDPVELERETFCSVCQRKMETFQYNGPGNIIIDTCHPCDLIWLDFGELQKVVNAPGRDRGVPRKPPKKEDSDPEPAQPPSLLGQALEELAAALFKKD